jgi:hypothetical protein
MKPKNEFQRQVLDASQRLPKITPAQVRWAKKNCIRHIGKRTAKGVITCTECGHSWPGDGYLADTLTNCRCPNCDTALKVETTRRSKFDDYEYLCIVTTFEGFQVLRFLYVECWMKAGEKARYAHLEAVQRWIAPDGRFATVARLRPMGYFVHGWSWGSDLEIRPEKDAYNITPTCIYPRHRIIPELTRRGYKGAFGKLTPFELMKTLLTEPKAETLLKAGYRELLQYFLFHSRNINNYWPSIRIAIRNGYPIEDAGMWADYIDLLRETGRDLRNAHYVCPADLKAGHDRYAAIRRAQIENEQIERKRRQALEDEARFRELKARFFGIEFTDGTISVRVLESVEEVMQEGDAMHHCVFTNSYHLRPDSLILSATIAGERLETIEFSLSRLAVLQCRGVCNGTTSYHSQIVDLVNKNASLIQKRMVA